MQFLFTSLTHIVKYLTSNKLSDNVKGRLVTNRATFLHCFIQKYCDNTKKEALGYD